VPADGAGADPALLSPYSSRTLDSEEVPVNPPLNPMDPAVLKALSLAPTSMLSDALGRWGNMEAETVVERVHTIHEKEERVRKALAAGQTTVDILGLRSRFRQ
jgi:hypothetical protein